VSRGHGNEIPMKKIMFIDLKKPLTHFKPLIMPQNTTNDLAGLTMILCTRVFGTGVLDMFRGGDLNFGTKINFLVI